MIGTISLYNPRTVSPEQLEEMLVGREGLLKEVLDNLRAQASSKTRQHWLLRGPRGMGKTHLTGIIRHRVQGTPELTERYLPLWLGEADVYEVYSPATLLERIAERLVELQPEAPLVQGLRATTGGGDEEGLFRELVGLLTQEAKRQDKVLLVLMENLDALLESFAPKERTAQLRQLRSLLLHNPHFLFVSTTPTRYLDELTNPKKPLYNQFKERSLRPLTSDEVGAVFSKLAVLTGRPELAELLNTPPEGTLRRKVVHQLTGGLPRSVLMAFTVMQDKSGIEALVEDLRRLLDAQTAYFEARLARLAARERAIVTTMALASTNLTLKEVSARSRLPEKSLSTLMSRLVQDGHVDITSGSGGKGTVYGLSEGLFRLWYQYRKGRLLLEPLVRLLAYLFNPSELADTVAQLKQQVEGHPSARRESAVLALRQAEEALRLATSEEGRLDRERLWMECREETDKADIERAHSRVLQMIFDRVEPSGTALASPGTSPYSDLIGQVIAASTPLPAPLAFHAIYALHLKLYTLPGQLRDASIQALQFLLHALEKNGHATPSGMRHAIPFIHLVLSFKLSETDQFELTLRHSEIALTHLGTPDYGVPEVPLEFGHWLRAEVLRRMGRIEEAIQELTHFVEHALRTAPLAIHGVHAAWALSRRYNEHQDWDGELRVLEQLLHLAESISPLEEETHVIGAATLRLGNLRRELGLLSTEATASSIRRWLKDFPSHAQRPFAQAVLADLEFLLKFQRIEGPREAAQRFLQHSGRLFNCLGHRAVRQLLENLVPQLPTEDTAPLAPYLLLTDVLEDVLPRIPLSEVEMEQALGRVPTELRSAFQGFIAKGKRLGYGLPVPQPTRKSKRG
ncbi:ATP-binding protein [Myxococcus sp. K15C18031901]|uniref:ATP-binding protein n=1 Tax=Myxococcus dinghuensis TaxID=2906761 RepID=UPI0020A7C02A|nr:ATP-binding protein [Myxococcus dinghuensis]MCP3105276.1 ATP-binding protein [Myxococcus dinghuensis]